MTEIKKFDFLSTSLVCGIFFSLFAILFELCRYAWIVGERLGFGAQFRILSFIDFLSEMLVLIAIFFLLGLIKGLVISYIYNKISEKIGGIRLDIG